MSPAKVREFFAILRRAMPDPKSELEHANPFELLVAVVMSAQATDKSVNLATRKLYPIANTPEALAKMGEEQLMEHIKTIGLFRMKAKNVVALSKMLLDKHGGKVPQMREALEELPGVGRKTANVVLNVAFGQPTMAVDTHVFRVSNRTGLAPGEDPLAVELKLLRVVPGEFRMNAHHWLILHGRYTCVAVKPKCHECPVYEQCGWPDKKKVAAAQRAALAPAARSGSILPKPGKRA